MSIWVIIFVYSDSILYIHVLVRDYAIVYCESKALLPADIQEVRLLTSSDPDMRDPGCPGFRFRGVFFLVRTGDVALTCTFPLDIFCAT